MLDFKQKLLEAGDQTEEGGLPGAGGQCLAFRLSDAHAGVVDCVIGTMAPGAVDDTSCVGSYAITQGDIDAAAEKAEEYRQQVGEHQIPFELWQSHELYGLIALAQDDYRTAVEELRRQPGGHRLELGQELEVLRQDLTGAGAAADERAAAELREAIGGEIAAAGVLGRIVRSLPPSGSPSS